MRAGEDIYVRSAYGPDNGWFRRAKASGADRIRAGGLQRDVTFAEAAADARDGIDAANQAKDGQHGRAIVGTVTGPDASETPLRLVPRQD